MKDRQRTAINEALHELRRPLQALALVGSGSDGVVESSTRLAAAALERLDREVNGGGRPPCVPVRCEAALRSAVGRWRARVALGGGSLELRWRAGEATVVGETAAFEQAVDNLIVNAIEHGGPEILVEGRRRGEWLEISIADSGGDPRHPRSREGRVPGIVVPIAGRRRGHGLALVRRFAAAQGGRFALRQVGRGSIATLELPLAAQRVAADSAA